MAQYSLEKNLLTLSVRKSPFIIRLILWTLAFSFFIFPISSMIASIASGNGFHFGFLIGIGIFSLIGFFMLRVSLWNTYGQETILFTNEEIIYEADYKWFKDAKKNITRNNISYSAKASGYEEDNEGILVIQNETQTIECVVKMPQLEVEQLAVFLRDR
ncbi:hypothetical protein ACFSJW_18600 [Flavobacterium artemisiae]|uniref:YcxB-like protein n=1 Tax=Flavobacterium artemisiae TaxID=2126556 RepID=A0ABW4HAD9_9FLAO